MGDDKIPFKPRNVSEAIVEASVRHAVFVERLKSGEVRAVIAQLDNEVLPDILGQLERALKRPGATRRVRTRRLGELSLALNSIITKGIGETQAASKERIVEIGLNEADWLRSTIRKAMPIDLELVVPKGSLIRASLVATKPGSEILGQSWTRWWNGVKQGTQQRTMAQVRIGLATGEGVDQITRRIRGTQPARNRDGSFQFTRNAAEAVVRTSISHITSQARSEVAKANTDVIDREKWLSTLDARTSQICAALDGRIFKVGEGTRPPAHVQCRSIMVPVLKSFRELGIDLDDPPPATRAARQYKDLKTALSGNVPGDVTYGKWLRRQPIPVQNAVLGPGKASLFRRGKVPMERFIDPRNRPLNLRELQALEASLDD